MKSAILNFPEQFGFTPKIENKTAFKKADKFIILGMGGSHLAADIIAAFRPEKNIIIHSDYGLPLLPEKKLKDYLLIASSYSGNTEEVLDGLNQALNKGLNVACAAVGGKLLETARERKLPFVEIPNTGIQPRAALGVSLRALAKIMGDEEILRDTSELEKTLEPKKLEEKGKELAGEIKNKMPIIYTSRKNAFIGYNWKIKMNETGKIPAFVNIFPELNHNEMTSFDIADSTRKLSQNFYFIFLKDDKYDHPKIVKRMEITAGLYRKRGLPVKTIELSGLNHFHKIFSSLLFADWTAFYTAKRYGLEAEQVPMVEEFKKLIK